jgi:hypothetical protein
MATLYTNVANNQRDGANFPGAGGVTGTPTPGGFNDPVFELGTCSEIIAVYTMTGAELANDVINIARIGQGVVVDPVRSSVAGNGIATTASVQIGDTDTAGGTIAASATRYSAAIAVNADMSATTAVAFAGGAALITPFETTDDPCWLTATFSILTVPVAAKVLVFRIKLNDNR